MIKFSAKTLSFLCLMCGLLCSSIVFAQTQKASAYPLITHDPYFSIWSFNDQLNAAPTKHWTGTDHSLTGFVKVDGKVYRFLGQESKEYDVILPSSDEQAYDVKYTETNPGNDWYLSANTNNSWKTGAAPFGDDKQYAKTIWKSRDLWVKRSFDLSKDEDKNVYLKLNHDDNIEVYLNGAKIYDFNGWVDKFAYIPLKQTSLLKKGKNLLAIYIKNTAGGQHLDFGLVKEKEQKDLQDILVAEQKNVEVKATQTMYNFACGPINLKATFTSPLILKDLNLLTRPVSYVTFTTNANDGKSHKVEVLLSASSNIAVNVPSQEIEARQYTANGLSILKAGTISQKVLNKAGDDLRIDWGYMYIAASSGKNTFQYLSQTALDALKMLNTTNREQFVGPKNGRQILLNTILDLGTAKSSSSKILIGYDDIFSIQYFGQNLRPWWNRDNNTTIEKQLQAANLDYAATIKKCNETDKTIYTDALNAGGEEYAKLCEMVYREAIAAHKVVRSPQGEILFLSKENFSNGSINTVDLTYPSAPLFLAYNPELEKGMMNSIFYYSESGKWTKPFAAHDIGTYPLGNGQTYGEDMPVEEAGNMICLAVAIAKVEGNADYAKKHWATITTWAEYLSREGFDPANQLCTDDFAGHLARNTNLSLKAIMALESYAVLGKMLGKTDVYNKYHNMTKGMVTNWMKLADAGDHYSLVFEKPDTWSQKYNMVWDKVLKFNIFPASVAQKEIKFYLSKQNEYGLPLDSRKTYTKSDWIMWTATMADNQDDFKALVHPIYKFATETTSRVPLSDWHETTNGKQVGFQARSVVGGYFMKVLDKKLNK